MRKEIQAAGRRIRKNTDEKTHEKKKIHGEMRHPRKKQPQEYITIFTSEKMERS